MNLGFLITNMSGGGAARTVAALSGALLLEGHNVIVIQVDDSNSFYELSNNVKVVKLGKAHHSNRFINQIKRVKMIRRISSDNNLDFVVAMNVSMIYFAVLSTIWLKTMVIGTERSNPYKSLQGSIKQKLKKFLSLLTEGFIFQTYEASKFYPKTVQKKGIVIQNAVYSPEASCIPPSQSREKRITSVGRLIESKGFDFLIRTFSEFVKEFPEYSLDIYGEGDERDNLLRLITSLGLSEKITLHGNKSEVISLIINSSMFVFPSRHEGMPNALIEALAIGLPCISTDCSMGPNELIDNGINGILVGVDNQEELLKQMKRIVMDESLSLNLSKNAIKIRDTNSIEKITEQHLNYFMGILHHKDKGEKKYGAYK